MRDSSERTSLHQKDIATENAMEDMRIPDIGGLESRDKTVERFRLLWEHRAFLGKASTVGLVLGIVLALLIPNHYKSTVQLMPPDSGDDSAMGMMAAMVTGSGGGGGGGGGRLSSIGGGSGLGAIAGDLLGLKNTGAEFVGVLKSRTIQDRLVDKFKLQDVYGNKYKEDACQQLSDNSSVSEDRKSGMITIEVTDHDPGRATALATAYVDELNRLMAEISNAAAHTEGVFLENRLQQAKADLEKASIAFSDYASKNTAIDVEEQGKAMVEAAAAVQGQLIAMESDLKGLEQIYTPNNSRVRSAQSSIAELRDQLNKLGGPPGGSAPGQANPGETYPSIRQLPVLAVKYYDLYRDVKIQEAIYETLTSRYEMTKVQEVKDTPSVKVLDPASVPEKKSFPPRTLIVVLTVFFVFAGSCFWVFMRARWDTTSSSDPGKVLAQEVFHSVNARMPWSPPNGSRFHAMTHRAWTRLARGPRRRSTDTPDDPRDL